MAILEKGQEPAVRPVIDTTGPRTPAGRGKLGIRFLGYAALLVFAATLLLPFFWMVTSSLKDNNEIFSNPVRWLPSRIVWENYVNVWSQTNILVWLRNTLILSVAVTVLQLLTGSFAAYGFAKVRFPGRDLLFVAYIATIAVPWQSYMIPQFILFSKMGVVDNLAAIILLHAFSAFGVFLMRQYYLTIPEELSEAARVDGLSEYGIWWRIMLPLSAPALASLALLSFVSTWNDYLGPLIYLRERSLWTLQLGLRSLVSNLYDRADYAVLFAGLTLSVIPIAIIFAFGQRYFVQGIAATGVKG
ncbi:carbohydrate ABC transporter permease [Enemella evansiae]|uniref:carbohydrate ABC transporter permease n=1 Tax=Enemella evansiae TaxID=2016499 RepID=UPI00105DE77A|nr:carbohydrate ABC transporter permease [Enemella evansiae]TDO87731.1 carbohydrate ABC transporter membrane protein 2 (CUT1 family) [Enemella evansiae]